VRRAVDEIVGQRAACRVAAAVGQFGLQDAGRAGAEEDADAGLAVAGHGGADAVGETVGLQRELGQPVVAAVVGGKRGRQFLVVDADDFADPGVEPDAFERAGHQAATAFAQAGERRLEPGAEAGGGGVGGKEQRGHGGPRIHQAVILTAGHGACRC